MLIPRLALDKCTVEGCRNEKEQEQRYCAGHMPKCQKAGCKRIDLNGTRCCSIHRCTRVGCDNQSTSVDGVCQFHLPCSQEDCTRPGADEGGKVGPYCFIRTLARPVRHPSTSLTMRTDIPKTCGACKATIIGNDAYCLAHACGFRGCGEPNTFGENPPGQFCKIRTSHSSRQLVEALPPTRMHRAQVPERIQDPRRLLLAVSRLSRRRVAQETPHGCQEDRVLPGPRMRRAVMPLGNAEERQTILPLPRLPRG